MKILELNEHTSQSEGRNEMAAQTISNDPDQLNKPVTKKFGDWKKEPTIAELKEDLEYARQETDDQKANVEGWRNLRDTTGPESGPKTKKSGRSRIQPKLIRKHNEWRYPGLSEPFLNTERMFKVDPRTFEDKEKARQNELVLNWQFDVKLDKVNFIDRFVRKTVDEGTCIVRVGWEREYQKDKVVKPTFDFFLVQDQEQLDILNQAISLYRNKDARFSLLEESLQAAVEYSLEQNQPLVAVQTGTEETYENRMSMNEPSLKIIDIDNLFVDPTCDGEWDKAQYMIYTYEATPSQLKKQKKKFKNLDQVNWSANKIVNNLGNPDHVTSTPAADARNQNNGKQKVLVYEYWGLYDIHDTGEMVPVLVTWIGDTIIQMETNPFPDGKPPFVIAPYMPILGSSFGEADASLLQDNQRIIGAVMRGKIDLIGRSANAQTGYSKGFLDAVNKRRFTNGDDFEYNPNGDPRAQIVQMTYPEIPRSADDTIAQQNQEAEALTGVKSFSGGVSGEAYGKVATGIRGALDAAATREMSILRRLASAIQQIGRKIMMLNALYLSEEEVIRVTNEEFVTVKREDLKGNYDLIVDISTANVDEQKAQDLGFMLQTMGPDMDPGMSKLILSEIADLKRMPTLAQQIRTYEPQPDPIAEQMRQLELQKMQIEIAVEQAKMEKLQAEAQQIFNDTENDASGLKHERDIEKMTSQARGNQNLEVTKAILAAETPASNIQAGVGFNSLIEAKEERETTPRQLGSGFGDPSLVPQFGPPPVI